jgi:hypothetical protein
MSIMRIFAVGILLGLAACTPTTASEGSGASGAATASADTDVSHRVLRPSEFQSFVKNWDGDKPLCARIASSADWDRYFGAAAVGGANKPFEPDAGLWRTHVGYLLARSANSAADFDSLLRVQSVRRQGGTTQIDYRLQPGQPELPGHHLRAGRGRKAGRRHRHLHRPRPANLLGARLDAGA